MPRYVVTEADGTTVIGGPYIWDGVTPFTPSEMVGQPTRLLMLETPTRRNNTPPSITEQNRATITEKATQALTLNANYLALGTPTAAQQATQINRLTRECSALIRLQLAQFDSASDT